MVYIFFSVCFEKSIFDEKKNVTNEHNYNYNSA